MAQNCKITVVHDRPWYFLVNHGSSWLTVVNHGFGLCFLKWQTAVRFRLGNTKYLPTTLCDFTNTSPVGWVLHSDHCSLSHRVRCVGLAVYDSFFKLVQITVVWQSKMVLFSCLVRWTWTRLLYDFRHVLFASREAVRKNTLSVFCPDNFSGKLWQTDLPHDYGNVGKWSHMQR